MAMPLRIPAATTTPSRSDRLVLDLGTAFLPSSSRRFEMRPRAGVLARSVPGEAVSCQLSAVSRLSSVFGLQSWCRLVGATRERRTGRSAVGSILPQILRTARDDDVATGGPTTDDRLTADG